MARKGSDVRPVVARYAERRAQLKERVRREAPGSPELADVVRDLSQLPRDASPVRLRNRDQVDGRPRGYLPGREARRAPLLRHGRLSAHGARTHASGNR